MIKKEFSISELFGILSVVALTISVLANTYFYYSLDAIWVMSVLSPTFYVMDIIKVITALSVVIFFNAFFVYQYKALTVRFYKYVKKKKVIVKDQNIKETTQLINKNQKKYELGKILFVLLAYAVILWLFGIIFKSSGQVIYFSELLFISVLVGGMLTIFSDNQIRKDKEIVIFIMIFMSLIATCFVADTKLKRLNESAPITILKNKDKENWIIVDSFQDKAILLNQTAKHNIIKIVKFEEIDRIISNKK